MRKKIGCIGYKHASLPGPLRVDTKEAFPPNEHTRESLWIYNDSGYESGHQSRFAPLGELFCGQVAIGEVDVR